MTGNIVTGNVHNLALPVPVDSPNERGLERIVRELKSPWDWVALFVGATGGAIVTIVSHGADLGHSISAGALGAIFLRRAAVASRIRSRLRKKAKRLSDTIGKRIVDGPILLIEGPPGAVEKAPSGSEAPSSSIEKRSASSLKILKAQLDLDRSLFEQDQIENDDFNKLLKEYTNKFRLLAIAEPQQITAQPPVAAPPPVVDPAPVADPRPFVHPPEKVLPKSK